MEGRFKIVMTADTVGGVWTYATDLCSALNWYHVEVHLATMGGQLNPSQKQLISELSNVVLYESDYKLEWMENPWEDVSAASNWLHRIVREVNPDLIHFNNFGQVDGHWDCPTLTVFHSCVLTWWQSVKQCSAPAQWNRYSETVKAALENSNVVVFPTKEMLTNATKVYGPVHNARTIYNGTSAVNPCGKKKPFVFAAGRIWDEAKNVELLTKIATRLPWPVLVAGNNSHPVTGKIAEYPNVTLMNHLTAKEMQEKLQVASIFVSPAKYEPFGLAVLEAAQAGCALVLSDIGTFREIWGDSALYFNPQNPDEAQEVVSHLINDEELRTALASKAMARSAQFTIERMASAYHELYAGLIGSKVENQLTV